MDEVCHCNFEEEKERVSLPEQKKNWCRCGFYSLRKQGGTWFRPATVKLVKLEVNIASRLVHLRQLLCLRVGTRACASAN